MKFQPTIFIVVILISFIACNKESKVIPESVIYTNMPENGYEMEVYDTLVISPKITYDYNTSYEWKQDGVVISNTKDLTLIANELHLYSYQFSISNDRGTDTMDIWAQAFYTSNFEDLTLDENTFWNAPNEETSFSSSILTYSLNGTPGSRTDWYGFTYSNLIGNQSTTRNSYCSAYKAPTTFTSKAYCVLRQDSSFSASYISLPEGVEHKFKSIALNTSYGTYIAIRDGVYGGDTCKVFGGESGADKDFLSLDIRGIKADGTTTDTYRLFLADYRFDNNRENYIINSWSAFNLEDIGFVNKLELRIVSTDIVNGYLQTPAAICLDELKIME